MIGSFRKTATFHLEHFHRRFDVAMPGRHRLAANHIAWQRVRYGKRLFTTAKSRLVVLAITLCGRPASV
ncbi:hypothetical protein SB861_32770 [Paraburkholderia sp. SIMBA_049]